MSFFGNTLVEKGIISKDQLVDALVAQSSQIPASLQITYEKGLLDPNQTLKVISARKTGESFTSVCTKMDLMSEEIKSTIEEEQKNGRQPLGQILVDKFGVDLGEISGILGETKPAVTEYQASPDFNFSFPQVSGETKRQYLDFFSKELKNSLESGFNKLNEAGSDVDTELMKLEESLQQLTAAANFARMEISYTLSEKVTLLIEGLAAREIKLDDNRELVTTSCITALDILWELHRFIDVSGDEIEFWKNDVSKNNFSLTIGNLEACMKGAK